MAALRQIITVPLAVVTFFAVFYSIGQLIVFLSWPSKIRIEFVWILNLLDNWSRFEKALLPITIDTVLITLFVLQHSLMRTNAVKALWRKFGLETAERSIYNLATSATILVSIWVCGYSHSFKFYEMQLLINSFCCKNGNRRHRLCFGM